MNAFMHPTGLLEQLTDLLGEVGVGAVGRGGGVGGHLGPVQGHQSQADHAGCRAQLQRGDQQSGQGLLVADPEPSDGYMAGGGVGVKDRGTSPLSIMEIPTSPDTGWAADYRVVVGVTSACLAPARKLSARARWVRIR
jgi:hypothetical protein